ncbi:3376_t:CDS:2, partial [Scutellospora calospora]
IFDATDGISQIQKIVDDDNTTEERLSETERSKTYNLLLEEYLRINTDSVKKSNYDYNYLAQQTESPIMKKSPNSLNSIIPLSDENFEFTKLQKELISIAKE